MWKEIKTTTRTLKAKWSLEAKGDLQATNSDIKVSFSYMTLPNNLFEARVSFHVINGNDAETYCLYKEDVNQEYIKALEVFIPRFGKGRERELWYTLLGKENGFIHQDADKWR